MRNKLRTLLHWVNKEADCDLHRHVVALTLYLSHTVLLLQTLAVEQKQPECFPAHYHANMYYLILKPGFKKGLPVWPTLGRFPVYSQRRQTEFYTILSA